MTYPLARDGIFWTLQGEGALLGHPMRFVRLAGCSVGCVQCDMDTWRTVQKIAAMLPPLPPLGEPILPAPEPTK